MSYTPETTILGSLEGIDLNSTADQAIAISANKYTIRRIMFCDASTTPTLATGGVYSGAGKTGDQIVTAAQVYTVMTSPSKLKHSPIGDAVSGDYVTFPVLYFSLTTANGSACTASVYVMGERLE